MITSGKGGSGKTTLALSLAQVLSYCEINVLLLDCDFVTNGCTLFFEDQLVSEITVQELMQKSKKDVTHRGDTTFKDINHVNKCFHFIPSIVNTKGFKSSRSEPFTYENIQKYTEEIKAQVVIFDCQAGYSDVTEFLMQHSNINLVVLEADAISVSALRVLYSKISKAFDSTRTFQVLNKITNEEYDFFSKVTAGTMFPNLTPILFDWSVRKSFAVNQLPEVNIHKTIFSSYVLDLAQDLLPKYRKEINKFIYLTKKGKLELLQSSSKTLLQFSKAKVTFLRALDYVDDYPEAISGIGLFILFVFVILGFAKLVSLFVAVFVSSLSLLLLATVIYAKASQSWSNLLRSYEEAREEQESLEEEVEIAKLKLGI